MAYPKVLVSILVYNNYVESSQTIRSFQAQSYPNFQPLVVDNASTDGCADKLKEEFPEFEIVTLPENHGYTGGNNYALKLGLEKGYDFVIVANHDIIVSPDLVENLVETAQREEGCALVGVIEEDYATGRIKAIGGKKFSFLRARGGWETKLLISPEMKAQEVNYVQGALILFTKKALERGVLLDEKLFMYCEENDLFFQLKEKGLKAFVDLRTHVRHNSVPRKFDRNQGYYLQRNRIYINRKYAPYSIYLLSLCYIFLFEWPAKVIIRSLQGRFAYVRSISMGLFDGLFGRMGRKCP